VDRYAMQLKLSWRGEGELSREIRRDFIHTTIGFPALAEKTGIHVKSLPPMFGPQGNPTAANLFNVVACLQEHEGVKLQVVA
jgi:DNA-binding phage protein